MADIDLAFSRVTTPDPNALDLILGPHPGESGSHVDVAVNGTISLSGAVVAKPIWAAAVAGTIPLSGSVTAAEVLVAAVAGTITLSGVVACTYDDAVPAQVQATIGTPWSDAVEQPSHQSLPWGTTALAPGENEVMWWKAAGTRQARAEAPWSTATPTETDSRLPWGTSRPERGEATSSWRDAASVFKHETAPWDSGAQAFIDDLVAWSNGRATARDTPAPWHVGREVFGDVRAPWGFGRDVFGEVRAPWGTGILVWTTGSPWSPVVITPGDPQPVVVDLELCGHWKARDPNSLDLILGVDPCTGQLPSGALVVVPVRSVYVITNNVTLVTSTGVVLVPLKMSMSIDAESWTWNFGASLPATALAAIEPDVDGNPVELVASVNGVEYRFLVESISRERVFGNSAITIRGRGKTALLDSPYAPVLNYGNTSSRTAAQLMDDVLMLNAVSIGWTVDFGLDDWLVPGNIWTASGSYISALAQIATAGGGYLQPHPTADQIIVRPRYPVAPWNWGTVVADISLPSAVTQREAIEWVEKPRYNRVFISGTVGGILGQVTRTGSAGDIVAPMVTDALTTAAAAARQRGVAILGDTGRIANVSLRLPVLAETGVIQPGKFVEYVDGSTTRRGLVRSTSVEISLPEVWQTIGVETHA